MSSDSFANKFEKPVIDETHQNEKVTVFPLLNAAVFIFGTFTCSVYFKNQNRKNENMCKFKTIRCFLNQAV